MISYAEYQKIQELKEMGLSQAKVGKYMNLSKGIIERWWHLSETEYFKAERNDKSSLENYREYIISILKLCPQINATNIYYAELIIVYDKTTVTWNLVGDAAGEASRKAREEYEGHPVVKTIKALVEKHPSGWRGNCSEIKLQIYEQTGTLFDGSADTVGRAISKYLDRLSFGRWCRPQRGTR